ncbi:cytochrome c [Phenylobacterium sp.]|uniref:c-type cytochrome n=1 Tax=Phenylobacterium sp. TaxID=1871053 RepID=UPI0035B49BF0
MKPEGKAQVATDACAGCHGEGFVGRSVGPRLAGQGEAYLGRTACGLQTRRAARSDRGDEYYRGLAVRSGY